MQSGAKYLLKFVSALGVSLLGACNYYPSTSGGGSTSSGFVSAAMTDAPSDEIDSFVVDVTGLQLKKADGATVSLVGVPVTVDLASLTAATQLLDHAGVPAGVYTSATITLDFTNAICLLAGRSTPATILDDTGAAVSGTLSFPIQLDPSAFAVAANGHRLLEFDFDLDQSLVVDASANSVALEPALAVHVDGSGKQLLAFASLVSVDASAGTFIGDITTLRGVVLGDETFRVDATTVYQVDGVPALGAPGLAALSAKPPGTWTEIYGAIDAGSTAIRAQYVEAGTGTFNGGTDIVEGHVIDRVGNPPPGNNTTLVVRGRSTNAMHTIAQYDTTFDVTTNFAQTRVVRTGSAQAFDTDDLNVGQRVRVFGVLNGTSMNASMPDSVVREEVARAFGSATAAISAGTLTLDLQHIDLRPTSLFAWPDSGSTPPDPSMFTVSTGTLGNTLAIASGTPVEARGFLAAVGDGAQDFVATSLIDLASAPAFLFVKDLPAGMTVTVTASATEIDLAITGTPAPAERAIVDHGFAGVDPLPTTPTPSLRPASGAGPFMLRDKTTGAVTVFAAFDTFANALGSALAQGASLRTLGAKGDYDAASNTMSAASASIVIQ